jgi:hypothetical protein
VSEGGDVVVYLGGSPPVDPKILAALRVVLSQVRVGRGREVERWGVV